MKALFLRDYRKLEMTNVPRPEVGPTDILVQVKACGICGSDIHGFDGSTGRRIPPLIMGHEASGLVAEVGNRVSRFQPGDRVTFDSTIYCGQCFYCHRGQVNLCEDRQVLGVSCDDYRRHGAFAEYVVVPERITYHLPEALSFEHAALIEAVAVSMHAVNRTPIILGDVAVVVGAGMIGLLVVQVLRAAGCGTILAVDLDEDRLALARRLGADDGLNPARCEVPLEAAKRTDGRGADIAIEAVGIAASVNMAIASVRKGGVLTLVGNLAQKVELPLQGMVTRELNLLGSCASSNEFSAAMQMLARGAIQVKPLISAVAPLDEGPSWFERLHRQEPNLMKVILQPSS
ncbi:MAG: zinc-dependent alcohol dehydrogenase [Terriglobia bacterium]